MLHLKAGVHFEEVELFFRVEQKLNCTGTGIIHCLRRLDCRLSHAFTQLRIDRRGWHFLDDLLVPALHRAVAFAQMDEIAVAVGKHLYFHMAGLDHRLLQDQLPRPECILRFRTRLSQRGRKIIRLADEPHAAPAAARRSLYHDRKTDLASSLRERRLALVLALISGHAGHARLLHQPLGLRLVAHRFDGLRRRADEHQPGIRAGTGERRIL